MIIIEYTQDLATKEQKLVCEKLVLEDEASINRHLNAYYSQRVLQNVHSIPVTSSNATIPQQQQQQQTSGYAEQMMDIWRAKHSESLNSNRLSLDSNYTTTWENNNDDDGGEEDGEEDIYEDDVYVEDEGE